MMQSAKIKKKNHGICPRLINQQRREARITYSAIISRQNYNRCEASSRLIQKHFLIAKKNWLESQKNMVERSWRTKKFQAAFETLRLLNEEKPRTAISLVINNKGNVLTNFDDQLTRWAGFYENVLMIPPRAVSMMGQFRFQV